MNKKLLTTLFLVVSLFSSNAYADTVQTNTVPASTKSSVATIKTQLNSIQSKLNSITTTHRANVDNLIVNLLPAEQVNVYKQEMQALSGESTLKAIINFDVTDYATNKLNKYLNTTNAKTKLTNLTTSQKAAIKKDLNNLETVKTSYTQVFEQTKELLKNAKNDPVATIILRDDIANLITSQKRVLNETKNITKLTSNINKTALKAGVTLK